MKEIFLYGKKEINHLKKVDPSLGLIIDEIGTIERKTIPDFFTALINSIVGQQISTKAQHTIWNRMTVKFPKMTPEALVNSSVEEIQSCGISMRKAGYIYNAANEIVCKKIDLDSFPHLSDQEICKQLSTLNGIGIWTAEMLMIFSLQRPDILSWGDLAIHRGLRMLHRKETISKELFEQYRQIYTPYNSTASLYLWAIAAGAYELEDPALTLKPKDSKKQKI